MNDTDTPTAPPAVPAEGSKDIVKADIDLYYNAFTTRTSGIARDCVCGKTYYDPSERRLFEDGELAGYEADPTAFIAPYHPGGVVVMGVEYCDACNCWEPKAQRIVDFLREHQQEIGEFFRLEKERLAAAAKAVPTI